MTYFDIWPQLAIIGYSIYSISMSAYSFNRETVVKPPNWVVFIGQFVCFWFGGFVGITLPFLVFLALAAIGVGITYREVGKIREHTLFSEVFGIALVHLLLYWGNFYSSLINFSQ